MCISGKPVASIAFAQAHSTQEAQYDRAKGKFGMPQCQGHGRIALGGGTLAGNQAALAGVDPVCGFP